MIHYQKYSLLKHNTFGFNVQCNDFYEYSSKEELSELYREGVFKDKWLPVGEGSNLLLLNDLTYPVLHSNLTSIEIVEESDEYAKVRVGSGVIWDEFVQWTIQHQLGGAENLSFIPGMVGASPVQNIGAYGVEAKDIICQVEVYDTQTNRFFNLDAKDCAFEYRGSIFKKEKKWLVVNVVYLLEKSCIHQFKLDYGNVCEKIGNAPVTLELVRQVIVDIRKSKLPLPSELGSAGSFFKNPVVSCSFFEKLQEKYKDMPFYQVDMGYKIPAAWLISQCGWKGKSIGAAGVYEKQPLILVNHGGATGVDILFLMHQIQLSVKDKFGIELNPEVCLVQ